MKVAYGLYLSPLMSDNLGFLTIVDHASDGLTGGYLVLNRAGHPLEFHCTVPLSPDKIQQILYGNTLLPFLYGERIAQTLVQRSKLPVLSIFTDRSAVLTVQTLTSTPIIYVFGELTRHKTEDAPPPAREISEELSESLKTFGIDNSHLQTRTSHCDEMTQIPLVSGFDTGIWQPARIGNRQIAVPTLETEEWKESLIADIRERARMIDLLEPFARIRLALEEAKNAA